MIDGATPRNGSRLWFWRARPTAARTSPTTPGRTIRSKPATSFLATIADWPHTEGGSTACGRKNLRPRRKSRTRVRTARNRSRNPAARSSKLEPRTSRQPSPASEERPENEKAISRGDRLSDYRMCLERLDVLSLPALGALGYVELHTLTLLQALEAARLDR